MGATGFLAPDFWLPSTVAPCLEVESLGVSPVDGNQKSGEVPPVDILVVFHHYLRGFYTSNRLALGYFSRSDAIQIFTAIFPTRKTKSHENKT